MRIHTLLMSVAVTAMFLTLPLCSTLSHGTDWEDVDTGMSFDAEGLSPEDMEVISSMRGIYNLVLSGSGMDIEKVDLDYTDNGSENLRMRFGTGRTIDEYSEYNSIDLLEYGGHIRFTATVAGSKGSGTPVFDTDGIEDPETANAFSSFFGNWAQGRTITMDGDFSITRNSVDKYESFWNVDDETAISLHSVYSDIVRMELDLECGIDGKTFTVRCSDRAMHDTDISREFTKEPYEIEQGDEYMEITTVTGYSIPYSYDLDGVNVLKTFDVEDSRTEKEMTVKASDLVPIAEYTSEGYHFRQYTMTDLKMMLGVGSSVDLAQYGKAEFTYGSVTALLGDVLTDPEPEPIIDRVLSFFIGLGIVILIVGIFAFSEYRKNRV